MARIIFSEDETYEEISKKDFEEIAKIICDKNKFVLKVELVHKEEKTKDIVEFKRVYEYKEKKTYVD